VALNGRMLGLVSVKEILREIWPVDDVMRMHTKEVQVHGHRFVKFESLVTDNMTGGIGGETGSCRRKSNDDESRIPVPSPGVFRRSASLRLRGERPSPRSFPAPIAEGGQSCAKTWPSRLPNRHRSHVSVT
jgi:hypothetical protein